MNASKYSFKALMTLCCAMGLLFFTSCEDDDDAPSITLCGGVECADGETCLFDLCISCDAPHVVKSGPITEDETWTSGNIYVLNNKVIVNSGVTLTIEPGTIVKGAPGLGSVASALVVARGGKLIADGTASNPITFTALSDNICVGETQGTNLTTLNRGLWGGLIILGSAPISAPAPNETEAQIEGIPPNESYNLYGGDNANDNSGTLRYVSVRHGGIDLGDNDEINGITFGGVGSGTTVENIEVIANLDDGVEFFGGSVDVTNLVIVHQGDDAIDVDQAYSGDISNFIVVMGGAVGDEALELDGPEGSANNTGAFTIQDGTVIASEANHSAADLKSRTQGFINRVSFQGFRDAQHIKVRASFVEDGGVCMDAGDAYLNLISGDLNISDSEIVSGTTTMENFITVYPDDDACDLVDQTYQTAADDQINGGANVIVTSPSTSRGADLTVFNQWSYGKRNNLF